MINDDIRELAQGPNHAAFTTVLPSGQLSTQIMWVDSDDEHILINTEVHSQKFENVLHDPRVAVAIWDADRPSRYAEIRGNVVETLRGPEARAHIDKLAQKYAGRSYRDEAIKSERVILVIAPERQRIWDSASSMATEQVPKG